MEDREARPSRDEADAWTMGYAFCQILTRVTSSDFY